MTTRPPPPPPSSTPNDIEARVASMHTTVAQALERKRGLVAKREAEVSRFHSLVDRIEDMETELDTLQRAIDKAKAEAGGAEADAREMQTEIDALSGFIQEMTIRCDRVSELCNDLAGVVPPPPPKTFKRVKEEEEEEDEEVDYVTNHPGSAMWRERGVVDGGWYTQTVHGARVAVIAGMMQDLNTEATSSRHDLSYTQQHAASYAKKLDFKLKYPPTVTCKLKPSRLVDIKDQFKTKRCSVCGRGFGRGWDVVHTCSTHVAHPICLMVLQDALCVGKPKELEFYTECPAKYTSVLRECKR